jgi:hypothetical protein
MIVSASPEFGPKALSQCHSASLPRGDDRPRGGRRVRAACIRCPSQQHRARPYAFITDSHRGRLRALHQRSAGAGLYRRVQFALPSALQRRRGSAVRGLSRPPPSPPFQPINAGRNPLGRDAQQARRRGEGASAWLRSRRVGPGRLSLWFSALTTPHTPAPARYCTPPSPFTPLRSDGRASL